MSDKQQNAPVSPQGARDFLDDYEKTFRKNRKRPMQWADIAEFGEAYAAHVLSSRTVAAPAKVRWEGDTAYCTKCNEQLAVGGWSEPYTHDGRSNPKNCFPVKPVAAQPLIDFDEVNKILIGRGATPLSREHFDILAAPYNKPVAAQPDTRKLAEKIELAFQNAERFQTVENAVMFLRKEVRFVLDGGTR